MTRKSWANRAAHLERNGLYDPGTEHDACGVGLVAAIDGVPRRNIVEMGIAALRCVYHRGAVDADGKTGDGAGIHLQIPHGFFADHIARIGKPVTDRPLAVGMMFLPKKNLGAQEACRAIVESEILRLGYGIYGWRQVPVISDVIGEVANDSRPEIEQILVMGKPDLPEERFELELFIIRRRIENAVRARAINDFYICSFSSRSIIYKGLFKAEQLTAFYPDLMDERFVSAYAIFHQRFSTNTAPAWHLAQPFRMIAHNGEINTLKGNVNFMRSHEATFHCANFAGFEQDVVPVIPDNTSDTGALDAVMEILTRAGRPLPLSKLILIPPSWSLTSDIPENHKHLFSFCNTVSEPWDGPAAIAGSDGKWVIAGMDRNGLRPMRYAVTRDGLLALGSESGMVPVSDANVIERGRLGPGELIGIDLQAGTLYKDRALKDLLAAQHPYDRWVENIVYLRALFSSPWKGEDQGGSPLLYGSKTPTRQSMSLASPFQGEGDGGRLHKLQLAAGHTHEEIETILHPMAETGKEAIGSMGDDTPLAVLSDIYRPFHHFFRQNFSQVTNPPIDPLRERRVMSLYTRFGNDGNYLALDATHSRTLLCETPVLLSHELAAIEAYFAPRITRLDTLFEVSGEGNRLRQGIERLVTEAVEATRNGRSYLVLTDEHMDEARAPIPMILAVSAVHSHLVRCKLRKKASILVRTAECLEPHALAVLIGAGATVVNPYVAEATIAERYARGLIRKTETHLFPSPWKGEGQGGGPQLSPVAGDRMPVHAGDRQLETGNQEAFLPLPGGGGAAAPSLDHLLASYRNAMSNGLLKIMSKMGISVVSSYRGGLNFEAIGLSRALVAEFFPGLPSRISGIGLSGIEKRMLAQHARAFGPQESGIGYQESDKNRYLIPDSRSLPIGGFYRFRAREERHGWDGPLIHLLQSAVGKGSYRLYREYSDGLRALPPVHLRDLLDFRTSGASIPVDRVESVTEIRKRFVAPAMSLGALSPEAHETLAIAMNRIGAASNSGEGGEGPERYHPHANGDNPNSTIKQVASGRFGVTAEYLNAARELQIKIAQGAKPGEGGQLPGFKVTAEIARLRHATPGVMLISPPPHHDIYSIEDLAQLIYDLKQINPQALVSVKLVAQSGIGTIASGVAKAMADKIVVAGHTGGTGASPWSSIKYSGIPWEMGLAEANQVLTLNRLRHRVRLQTDGGLKTGRDIVIAAMLGAEEYALGTASLVAMGCLLVRQCHSNTCPVGITTQDPALRAKFEGSVDKVVNLFTFVAEEVREILASLGFTRLDDVIGRADLLAQVSRGSEDLVDLDLNALLAQADPGPNARYCTLKGRNEVPGTLDAQMIADAHDALERGEKIQLAYTVRNTLRSIGARLSSEIVRHSSTPSGGVACSPLPVANHSGNGERITGNALPTGGEGLLHPDRITLRLRGSAGQSLGAFLTRGVRIELYGDANDYVGKGLSGGTVVVRPRPSSSIVPHENTIIGNTVLYGATGGRLFASGQAGERFAVRNSGAVAVVEGCGSNGCEYMTGGIAVILGDVGHNFAAGMTGGMAFVYDAHDHLDVRLNPDSVLMQRVASVHWENVLKDLIAEHGRETGSPRAETILSGWEYELPRFRQICPLEMAGRLEHPLSDETPVRLAK